MLTAADHKEEFLSLLGESLKEGSFVKLSLGKYRGEEAQLQKVSVRLVTIKNSDQLSFLYRYQTKDVVKNHPLAEGIGLVSSLLGATFLSGHLFTTERDAQLEFSKKLKSRMSLTKPTLTSHPSKSHDRKKSRQIELENNLYLKALGVTNERGEVRGRMGDKWRQINKFIETVGSLFDSSCINSKQEISIVDMGSGKGYLTFAVYDYFNNVRGLKASVVGVEARRELVDFCNTVARDAGFDRLRFEAGYIRDYELEKVDILIALHACNTATDEAIYQGIKAEASVIICAPCCHQQIRPQIDAPMMLRPILRHGILLEREAETATDGLRALLLELSGYNSKVFEFISTEHTHKNTMLVGVKQNTNAPDQNEILKQIEAVKNFYGIREHYLEALLQV
jgi:SAM-dependent methyltransferase